jgi:phospholipase/carboxylesterase
MVELLTSGAPLARARAAAIMVHGRGSSAEDILSLGKEFGLDDVAYVAPQAANHAWYPYSFLAPFAQNEPDFSQSLATLGETI